MSQQFHRSNLGRRLKKLDVELTDECGLVPHSARWRAYWMDWMQKFVNGESAGQDYGGGIPHASRRDRHSSSQV
jgi:hypothetical protein